MQINPTLSFTKPENCVIQIGCKQLKQVNSYKYLGLIIDSKLTWNNHIEHVNNNILSYLFALKRSRCFLSTHTSYIHSRLTYLNPIWNSASKFKEISVLQNKTFKIIYQLPSIYPTKSLQNTYMYIHNDHNIRIQNWSAKFVYSKLLISIINQSS